jgi:uncharacterized protein YfaS (alpha-2-macroglobulin family)
VVASAARAFGSGQSATLVRSPLLAQSSWPRFAAPGDRFLVPVVVFNNSTQAGRAKLTLRVEDGPIRFGLGKELAVDTGQIPAGGQQTKWLEANATQVCGVSHISLTAALGNESYSETLELPVRPPSPEVTVGGYAVATPDHPALISLPQGMLDGTTRLELKVTPAPMLQLPQGLDYLERYPYGCLEQTTSTLFPLVYLPDIGQQIAPGVFEKERIARKVQAGITRLIGMQTANGGLSMWPGYREAWPWGSVYAAHFLIEAQRAGHDMPEDFRRQLLGYVRGLLNQSSDNPEVLSTQAYACYVLAISGSPERAVMSRLTDLANVDRTGKMDVPGDARFHLAAAWLAAGRRDLAEGLIPQSLPAPRDQRLLGGTLGSPVRDRAILVNMLLEVEPEHPGLAEQVQQLADAGSRGQWRSTQDVAFAVLALGRYLRQSNAETSYDSARLLLDGREVRSTREKQPLLWDANQLTSDSLSVEIAGKPDARGHVSWLAHGVPLAPPAAANNGMTVRRTLLDERGKPIESGRVRSGDLLQIELEISAATPLENLVIEDLLPAGLEIENPRLKTTAAVSADAPKVDQNAFQDVRLDMRDDRLVVMGSLVRAGAGTFVYTARAVTAGRFVLPPVHAECMYDNGTSSTSPTANLEVTPAAPSRVANLGQGD